MLTETCCKIKAVMLIGMLFGAKAHDIQQHLQFNAAAKRAVEQLGTYRHDMHMQEPSELLAAMVSDANELGQSKRLANPLETTTADLSLHGRVNHIFEEMRGVMASPIFQEKMKGVADRIEAIKTDRTFQQHAKQLVDQTSTLMAASNFQDLAKIAEQQKINIKRGTGSQERAQLLAKQLEATIADPSFQNRAKLVLEEIMSMREKKELNTKIKLFLKEVVSMADDPNFQEQAKRITERMESVMTNEMMRELAKDFYEQMEAKMSNPGTLEKQTHTSEQKFMKAGTNLQHLRKRAEKQSYVINADPHFGKESAFANDMEAAMTNKLVDTLIDKIFIWTRTAPRRGDLKLADFHSTTLGRQTKLTAHHRSISSAFVAQGQRPAIHRFPHAAQFLMSRFFTTSRGCGMALRSTQFSEDGSVQNASAPLEPTLQQKCLAEVIGTGLLIQLGCGVVCSQMYGASGLSLGQIALVWGFIVALIVYCTRDISGAHLNPAITISLAINKPSDVSKKDILPYVSAQMVGASVAAAINYLVYGDAIAAFEAERGIVRGTMASTASFSGAFGLVPNPKLISPFGALAAEVWMTATLVFLIFGLTDPKNKVPTEAAAPALIGAAVTVLIQIWAPITGCGMNPARDLGPRLVTFLAGWDSAAFDSWWIYTIGPIIGAVVGGALYQVTFAEND